MQYINLAFPLKKCNYYIMDGGNNILLNYHQELKNKFLHKAFDIVKLDKYGKIGVFSFSSLKNNEDYIIYSDSVFSPCDGFISDVVKNEPDHKPGDLNNYLGKQANIVVIKAGYNSVVLVHFKYKSIVVNPGNNVKTGEFLGLVGNSGESSIPHLHIHVRDDDWRPVDIKFNNHFYKKNDIIKMGK